MTDAAELVAIDQAELDLGVAVQSEWLRNVFGRCQSERRRRTRVDAPTNRRKLSTVCVCTHVCPTELAGLKRAHAVPGWASRHRRHTRLSKLCAEITVNPDGPSWNCPNRLYRCGVAEPA